MAKFRLAVVMVMLIALGAVLVDARKKAKVRMYKLYNKTVLKLLPPSEFPAMLNLLKKAISNYQVSPKYILVANEIVKPHQPKKKRSFNIQFADGKGNLFGFLFSHENGKFTEDEPAIGFTDKGLTKLIKSGKIDEARKRATSVILKVVAILKKGKPKDFNKLKV